MKKLLTILLILVGVLGSITLTSCDKDDDDGYDIYQETLQKYENSVFEGKFQTSQGLIDITIEFEECHELNGETQIICYHSYYVGPCYVIYNRETKSFLMYVLAQWGDTYKIPVIFTNEDSIIVDGANLSRIK